MFSSPLGRGRPGGAKEVPVPRRDTSSIEDPTEEFNYLLDRLGCLMDLSRDSYDDSQALKDRTSEKTPLNFFRRNRKKDNDIDDDNGEGEINEDAKIPSTAVRAKSEKGSEKSPSTAPPLAATRPSKSKEDAVFLPIAEEEECVEIIRRLAELVIIGERVVATQMEKEDKKQKHQQKQGWGVNITDDQVDASPSEPELEPGSEAYIGIFDLFFERNGLGMIVDILTGDVFQRAVVPKEAASSANASDNINSQGDETESSSKIETDGDHTEAGTETNSPGSDDGADAGSGEKVGDSTTPDIQEQCRLLPSLKVAIQAVQSVSILVQNVARNTSLYFVLSNNYVNSLIDLPLDLYSAAERRKLADTVSPREVTAKTFTTPELQELTTHFVTFLKSLAMRMNTETLQFYLKYPTHSTEEIEKVSEETRARAIEFPLYARALDFCAAHHDSFVRVSAYNICLNTLRLTTVAPVEGSEDEINARSVGDSPDGVLHNAKPLPFRERLAIATHTCAPSRVGRLASPIFTKLSTLWCLLQEKFLNLDTPVQEDDFDRAKKSGPTEAIKERERRHNAFKDAAATLQDQLLLLDDLLKVYLSHRRLFVFCWCFESYPSPRFFAHQQVGLTALNEQIIEMMLATFVYPLLLQPLLVYYQRLPFESGEAPPILDPFAKRVVKRSTVDFNEVGRVPPEVSAPAKTALFTLAAVFHLISNRPLIRLLYTALFHPLSPAATGETVISAEGCVTGVDEQGNKGIRIDGPACKDGDERTSYPFGGKEQVSSAIDHDAESCVFVLSPALDAVLKLAPGTKDAASLSTTRPNPYRRAMLQMLEVPHHMSDFRKLSFNTLDSAVSLFDGDFLVDTLLGKGISDRSNSDSTKYMNEVVSALCEGLVNGKPGPFGERNTA